MGDREAGYTVVVTPQARATDIRVRERFTKPGKQEKGITAPTAEKSEMQLDAYHIIDRQARLTHPGLGRECAAGRVGY